MNVRTAHRVLSAAASGEGVSGPDAEELLARGLLERRAAQAGDLDELRLELKTLRDRRAKGGGDPDAERRVKDRILQASAQAQGGAGPSLTWQGRELLDEMIPRLDTWAELELSAFEAGLRHVEDRLAVIARAAAQLVPRVQAALGDTSPGIVRSTAIGLAGARDPEEALASFGRVVGKVPSSAGALVRACLGEGYALGPRTVEVDALVAAYTRAVPTVGALEAAFGVVLRQGQTAPSISPDQTPAARILESLAPAGGPSVGEIPNLWGPEADYCRAILRFGPPDALQRYQLIFAWIERMGIWDTSSAPHAAALLACLDTPAPETLDVLRMATDQVERAGLPSGLVPALALGVKLQLVTAGTLSGLTPLATVRAPLPAHVSSVGYHRSSTRLWMMSTHRPTHSHWGSG